MLCQRILGVAAVALLAGVSMAATASTFGVETRPFTVFDGLLYKGKPDTGALGMTPIRQVNSPVAANPGPHNVDDDPVRATLSGLRDYSGVAFLDYELWPLNPASPDEFSKNIATLNRVLGLAHEVLPAAKFGYYALLPCPDYWRWP